MREQETLIMEPEEPTEPEAAAQLKLQKVVKDLQDIRAELADINKDLPVPPSEGMMLLGEEEMDVSTEIRSVIECVVNDSILPAIRDLAAAAAYRTPQPQEKKGG
jgi:5,10-methenyltetrahydromethanopterin hydrogenase